MSMRTSVNKLLILLLTCYLASDVSLVDACTTAVISGKATADGRPLLWKNRDFSVVDNELIVIEGGTYRGIAIVNKGSTKSIWMGCNEKGFCIENSVSNDLKDPKAKSGLGNGSFMLKAIQTCANISDFEALLNKTDGNGRSTTANFGVIDAEGGAAIFETSPTKHVKFDANDPKVAPEGFVVRSNFSFQGQKFEGSCVAGDGSQEDTEVAEKNLEKVHHHTSGQRFLRARDLLSGATPQERTVEYIMNHCMRDMADDEGKAFDGTSNSPNRSLPEFIPTATTISRSTTVSACCFQGIRPGEKPQLTTMWVVLGDPKFSIAVPSWPVVLSTSPQMHGGSSKKGSSLCSDSLTLRAFYFDKSRNGVHTEGLENVFSEIGRTQEYILNATQHELESWRTHPVSAKEITEFHQSMAKQASASLARQVKLHASRPPIFTPLPEGTEAAKDESEAEETPSESAPASPVPN